MHTCAHACLHMHVCTHAGNHPFAHTNVCAYPCTLAMPLRGKVDASLYEGLVMPACRNTGGNPLYRSAGHRTAERIRKLNRKKMANVVHSPLHAHLHANAHMNTSAHIHAYVHSHTYVCVDAYAHIHTCTQLMVPMSMGEAGQSLWHFMHRNSCHCSSCGSGTEFCTFCVQAFVQRHPR